MRASHELLLEKSSNVSVSWVNGSFNNVCVVHWLHKVVVQHVICDMMYKKGDERKKNQEVFLITLFLLLFETITIPFLCNFYQFLKIVYNWIRRWHVSHVKTLVWVHYAWQLSSQEVKKTTWTAFQIKYPFIQRVLLL